MDKSHEDHRKSREARRSRSRSHDKRRSHRSEHKKSRSRSRSREKISSKSKHQHRRDSSREKHVAKVAETKDTREKAVDDSWKPDWDKARTVVQMLLSVNPALHTDIRHIIDMLDVQVLVDISDVSDQVIKTGFKLMCEALDLEKKWEDAYVAPSGKYGFRKWFSKWFPRSYNRKPVLGPVRPTATDTVPPVYPSDVYEDDGDDDDIGPHLPGDPRAREPGVPKQPAPSAAPPKAGATRDGWMDSIAEGVFGKPKPEEKTLPRRLQISHERLTEAMRNPDDSSAAQASTSTAAKTDSLFDMCQQQAKTATAAAPKAARRPFDRERDLEIRRPVDAVQIANKIGNLDSRFGFSGFHGAR